MTHPPDLPTSANLPASEPPSADRPCADRPPADPPSLVIERLDAEGVVTLRVIGEAGWKQEADLAHTLRRVAETDPAVVRRVEIDLRGLTFAASTALGAFVAFASQCGRDGRTLVLVGTPPTVMRAMRHARLTGLFTFAERPGVD